MTVAERICRLLPRKDWNIATSVGDVVLKEDITVTTGVDVTLVSDQS
jgi:hypothetical protein